MFPLHPMFLFQSRSFNRGGAYYIYCTLEEICAVIEMIRGEMLPFATTKSRVIMGIVSKMKRKSKRSV